MICWRSCLRHGKPALRRARRNSGYLDLFGHVGRRIAARAQELASLKDLRQAVEQTQADLAAALGVGQDTISRLEKRSDMLLSTLRRYIESLGGKLELVAQFPNRPPVIIDRIGEVAAPQRRAAKRPRLPGAAA